MSSCAGNIAHFLVFAIVCWCVLSISAQFRTRCARPPAPAAALISPARPVWYWVQTGAACPASGRVRLCAVSCVVCLASGTACAVACRVQSVRVRWRGQGCTGGVYSRRLAPPGQSRHHRKNKKGSKNDPTPIANLQNFPQKQKDPYKGSVFCAILALQALKGRNLQWLKVK